MNVRAAFTSQTRDVDPGRLISVLAVPGSELDF